MTPNVYQQIARCHNSTICTETSLQEEVFNANLIRHEEKATNKEAIEDVQDAQSSPTEANQILTDFLCEGW